MILKQVAYSIQSLAHRVAHGIASWPIHQEAEQSGWMLVHFQSRTSWICAPPTLRALLSFHLVQLAVSLHIWADILEEGIPLRNLTRHTDFGLYDASSRGRTAYLYHLFPLVFNHRRIGFIPRNRVLTELSQDRAGRAND